MNLIPSSEPPRLRRKLRHQLLALWLGSILLVMLAVGLVLSGLIEDFRSHEARRDISRAVTHLRGEMVVNASALIRHADLLAEQKVLIATINMVHRYQNVDAYLPLVFDAEKRRLALLLADRVRAGDLSLAAVYDGRGRVAAFAGLGNDNRVVAGHHSVAEGAQILVNAETGTRMAEPAGLLTPDEVLAKADNDVRTASEPGRLRMALVTTIDRHLPSSAPETIGHVQVSRELGETFLASLSSRAAIGLGMVARGVQVGSLPVVSPGTFGGIPDLSLASGECACAWARIGEYDMGASSLSLDDGSEVLIIGGLHGREGDSMIRFYRIAAGMVLLGVAALVMPGGILLLDRLIVLPLTRLLDGVEALRAGRMVRLASFFRNDEFGTLASGFDAMAQAIHAREEELRRSVDHLARSNAELERFAVVAAHDLQEPLRMVASYTQLLKRRYQSRLDKEADEFIAYAVEGAERMKVLVQDLLDYSRVEGDQQPFQTVECEAVVAGALRNLQTAMDEAGARVTIHPLPMVMANAVQIGQVFQNLLSNAVKFRRGAPEIDISAHRQGEFWRFAVADNGIGIAPEYMDQLFTLFRRLHTRQEYPGSGLGLAIARRIVERHGGQMWAESTEGQGTRIQFTLPAPPHMTPPHG